VADPHEVNNLAGEKRYQGTVRRLAADLERWMEQTGDQGRTPEARETIEREEPRWNVRPPGTTGAG